MIRLVFSGSSVVRFAFNHELVEFHISLLMSYKNTISMEMLYWIPFPTPSLKLMAFMANLLSRFEELLTVLAREQQYLRTRQRKIFMPFLRLSSLLCLRSMRNNFTRNALWVLFVNLNRKKKISHFWSLILGHLITSC